MVPVYSVHLDGIRAAADSQIRLSVGNHSKVNASLFVPFVQTMYNSPMKKIALASLFMVVAWTIVILCLANPRSAISFRITDGQSGSPIPARVYLTKEENLILPEGFPSYDKKGERHFLVPPSFEISLGHPRRGLETDFEGARRVVELNPVQWVNQTQQGRRI